MIDKKGQAMTIWVIIALVIVVSVILFFAIYKAKITTTIYQDENPSEFIDKCVKKNVNEAIDLMLPQGGFVKPTNYKKYNGLEISYLCESIENYLPCVNQHPMFIYDLRNEIKNYISPAIEECFSDYKDGMEKNNWDVSMGDENLDVSLSEGEVYINISNEITLTKDGQTRNYHNFQTRVMSPIYQLANVAMDIADEEANKCYFDNVGYMMLNQKVDVKKELLSESSEVFIIKDKASGEELNIAIRGCVIPVGTLE